MKRYFWILLRRCDLAVLYSYMSSFEQIFDIPIVNSWWAETTEKSSDFSFFVGFQNHFSLKLPASILLTSSPSMVFLLKFGSFGKVMCCMFDQLLLRPFYKFCCAATGFFVRAASETRKPFQILLFSFALGDSSGAIESKGLPFITLSFFYFCVIFRKSFEFQILTKGRTFLVLCKKFTRVNKATGWCLFFEVLSSSELLL